MICFISQNFFLIYLSHATDSRVIDVASVTWNDANVSVSLESVVHSVKTEVGARWNRYTSTAIGGGEKIIDFQHGLTLLEPILIASPMKCDGDSSLTFMDTIRRETYKRLGIESWSKRYLVILAPNANCIWTGRGLIGDALNSGSVIILQDSASPFVIVHELGHALGLGHTNLLRCNTGANDGPWGNDCRAVEYGGTIDVMGNVDVDTTLSTYHQWRLGILSPSEVKQVWMSEKVTLQASDVAGGTRVIFLRDGKSTYWIEYRRASSNSQHRPGLVIYRSDPPPLSALVSPNREDYLTTETDKRVSTDIWMLNWDDYTYSGSTAKGSMTLPLGSTANFYSGNLSITVNPSANPDKVEVSVLRKDDSIAPPAPEITDPKYWKFQGVSIIEPGYDDTESTIAGFELDASGRIFEVSGSTSPNFVPTYLNPFLPARTVMYSDLPEGEYFLSIRGIDIWGNKGDWSKPIAVLIDHGPPELTKEFSLVSVNPRTTRFMWSGLRDEGSKLCKTLLHNEDGFVLSRSKEKASPYLEVPTGKHINGAVQVFDCLGNGVSGQISVRTKFVPPSNSKRTGTWVMAPEIYGPLALRCVGKCTASFATSGSLQALIGEGAATLSISGKSRLVLPNSQQPNFRISEKINVGTKSKLVRISGRDFVFGGLAYLEVETSNFIRIQLSEKTRDSSLDDPAQKELSIMGFNVDDFAEGWLVSLMNRGTTLLDPTLDLCFVNFKSESGRDQRRQILVYSPESRYSLLSSEVVKYNSSQAARAAFLELIEVYRNCLVNQGGSNNGEIVPFDFQDLPKSAAKLVSNNQHLVVRATIGNGVTSQQLLAFYQFHEKFFTGLYLVKRGSNAMPNDEVLRWFDVAEIMANRLSVNR